MSLNEVALAKQLRQIAEELHEIGDALFTTNALRGRRVGQLGRNLEGLASYLETGEPERNK